MRPFEYLKEKNKLIEENMEIRKQKHYIEQKFNMLNNNLNEITNKYIKLLEQKAEQFDLYVKYQNECIEYATKNREYKKEIATLKEQVKSVIEENNDLKIKLEKTSKKASKLSNEK